MAKSNEYRATHDEKNGVLKELSKLELQWKEESDRAQQKAYDESTESTKVDPKFKAVLQKYQAGVQAQKDAEAEAKKLGVTICAEGYGDERTFLIRPSNEAYNDLRQDFNRRLLLRLQKLSELRSQINLANLRSEVAKLDAAARKL